MIVTVRLFAMLRERAGRDSLALRLEDGATAADAVERLKLEPGLAEPLSRMRVSLAVNREYAEPDTPLAAADEIVLVPPVSGGDGARARVIARPLSPEAGESGRRRPARGRRPRRRAR